MSKQKKVLFIHHSTGGNLIRQGGVRALLRKIDASIAFFDHGYNLYKLPFYQLLAKITFHSGLTNHQGEITGRDYNIVLSNNSPKEYAEIFSKNTDDKTLNAILSYDIIAFKNCYPTTKITSENQLEEDKLLYKNIRDAIMQHDKKKFILVTPPPMREECTTIDNAKRAKKLIDFLTANTFLNGVSNLFIFDLFHLLANEQGFLKKEYTRIFPFDSHPNKKANREIAPIFAKYIAYVADM